MKETERCVMSRRERAFWAVALLTAFVWYGCGDAPTEPQTASFVPTALQAQQPLKISGECSDGEVVKWSSSDESWICGQDESGSVLGFEVRRQVNFMKGDHGLFAIGMSCFGGKTAIGGGYKALNFVTVIQVTENRPIPDGRWAVAGVVNGDPNATYQFDVYVICAFVSP